MMQQIFDQEKSIIFFFFFFDRRPREVYNGMLQQQIHNILNIP